VERRRRSAISAQNLNPPISPRGVRAENWLNLAGERGGREGGVNGTHVAGAWSVVRQWTAPSPAHPLLSVLVGTAHAPFALTAFFRPPRIR